MITRTEELYEMANAAEDAEKEVYVSWVDDSPVIRYIEIDGEEFENDEYKDELNDLYWESDALRVAESYMH